MKTKIFFFAILVLGILGAAESSFATIYYIDFDGGNDTNSGLSNLAPWKHSPGDPNATGNAASANLLGGDTVAFKGGVKYRGQLSVGWSGSSGNPITYKGNLSGWGNGKAIIEGADPFPNVWTKCESQAACHNNTNWNNIYYTTKPDGMTFDTHLLQNDGYLWWAQDPNPTSRIVWNDLTQWYVIPQNSATKNITSTAITDPSVFNQSDANYYNDAWIVYWAWGNGLNFKKVTSYNPSTNTVSYVSGGNPPYPHSERDDYYTILNHPMHVDQPGEYSVSTVDDKIYLWPLSGTTPTSANIEVATRSYGFSFSSKQFITIEGFKLTGTYGNMNAGQWAAGGAIMLSGFSNNIINNNEFTVLTPMQGVSAIYGLATNSVISNNSIHNNIMGRGITFSGDNVLVDSNTLYKIGGTGIWSAGSTNSRITRNHVYEIKGTHANGMSIYQNSQNTMVDRNYIENSGSMLTFEQSSNLTLQNNIFDGHSIGGVYCWGGMSGYTRILNNIFANAPANHNSLGLSGDVSGFVLRNNIIDGGGAVADRSHNVYTNLLWNQGAGYGWQLKEGEFIEQDQTKLFVNPSNRDYRPLSTGPLINTGSNLTTLGTLDDYSGASRPQGSGWDIGAFEYVSNGGDTTPPAAPSGLVVN